MESFDDDDGAARAGVPSPDSPAATAGASGAPQSLGPSQTLGRGIVLLERLAQGAASIDQLAEVIGVHRSVAYRLVRTLEVHGLVRRDEAGKVTLGLGLAALAAHVESDLRARASPLLREAADELGFTCFLAVADHQDCVTLLSAEPARALAAVARRPGRRHQLRRGAPGKAILSLMTPADWPVQMTSGERAEVEAAAELGWVHTHDEVVPGLHAVAVPLRLEDGQLVAVAAVYVGAALDASAQQRTIERTAQRLLRVTAELASVSGAAGSE